MADILELEPDLLELEQFHHEVIRPEQPIFNPLGQYCVVKRCSSMIKFHKLGTWLPTGSMSTSQSARLVNARYVDECSIEDNVSFNT